jgi:hypothetical protein
VAVLGVWFGSFEVDWSGWNETRRGGRVKRRGEHESQTSLTSRCHAAVPQSDAAHRPEVEPEEVVRHEPGHKGADGGKADVGACRGWAVGGWRFVIRLLGDGACCRLLLFYQKPSRVIAAIT